MFFFFFFLFSFFKTKNEVLNEQMSLREEKSRIPSNQDSAFSTKSKVNVVV